MILSDKGLYLSMSKKRNRNNKKSKWLRLNGVDLLKGLVVSIFSGIIDGLTTGHSLKESAIAGLTIGGGGYLIKNVLTDHKDKIKILPKININMSKSVEFVINRKYSDSQTTGDSCITENGHVIFKFVTLELPWVDNQKQISCVPEGEYNVVKRWSEKYRDHFHILDVENRSYILCHHGNFNTDTKGCILPGENLAYIDDDNNLDVTYSRKTMGKLNMILPDKFKLIIKSNE